MRFNHQLYLGILLISICACTNTSQQFKKIDSNESGVLFNNKINIDESLNILKYEYIYNGGGVAMADLNNDKLLDLVFTGNQVDNALYINRGDLKFEDASKISGIQENKRWSTGVAIVDINVDGLMDLYISSSGPKSVTNRANQLLICQEINADGIPVYKDQTEEYGLKENAYSTNAAFFDYDNDGDLDLVVINNHMVDDRQPSKYRNRSNDVRTDRTDLLFRNDWNESLNHPLFTDVSDEAGMLHEGFSLGLNIHDFNQDGWKDIYITNDYLTTDLLYINQKNGSFKDEATTYFKHTSFSAMGNDVVDLDNDGQAEVLALDMLPNDNYRRKTMLPPNNYTGYINNERYGYQYQQVRNTLQKNNFSRSRVGSGPIFSEQALLSGVAATDWSWAPIVADFDNDGDRDIIVTNGFPQDITDRDFVDYSIDVGAYASNELLLASVPSVKIGNVAFENNGGLQFENVSRDWGIDDPSFSNGAAYGDLDNDGDIDYVVNNIDDVAGIYENTGVTNAAWLQVSLKGNDQNPNAFGSVVKVLSDSLGQSMDYIPGHGYLSSSFGPMHFGLGNITSSVTVIVEWPDNTMSIVSNVPINQVLTIDYNNVKKEKIDRSILAPAVPFKNVTKERAVAFDHEEKDYTDYNLQPMLLHKLSQLGPGIAVGDVNNDGREDFFVSGSHTFEGTFYVQESEGYFVKENLFSESREGRFGEDLGVLLFDADGDADLDLYTVQGGYEFDMVDSIYQDRLYVNENGTFIYQPDALPHLLSSGATIAAADYDGDGDLDLFVGGRQSPGAYPSAVSSFILRNDSKKGAPLFTNVTNEVAKDLLDIGMITSALWTDFDDDGQIDLLLAGEFMSLQFYKNDQGEFSKINQANVDAKTGWWNSLVAGDFDKDGDTDYLAGNFGDNTNTPISEAHPITLYYADFDNNESRDLVPTCYFESLDGSMKEFPYFGRLEYEKQINIVKRDFKKHGEFAKATINEILNQEQRDSAYVVSASYLKSAYIENKGAGQFEISALPAAAQIAPVFGMTTSDINADGHLDVVMIGNDYSMEVAIGKADAHDGLVLLGNGQGGFQPLLANESGFYVQEDGKSLVKLYNTNSQSFDFVAAQNKGPLEIYQLENAGQSMAFEPNEVYAIIDYGSGVKEKIENNFGSGYLSQSSKYFEVLKGAQKVTTFGFENGTNVERRTLMINARGQ